MAKVKGKNAKMVQASDIIELFDFYECQLIR